MLEKKLNIKGFTSPIINNGYRPYTLNLLVFGPEGGGKSRFLATAPDPVGGLILDMKSETSIRREMELSGKQVVWPEDSITKELIHDHDLRLIRKMSDDEFKEHYQRRVDLMTDKLMELAYHKDIRTIFVDSFYQYGAEVKAALQGRKQKMKKLGSGKVFQDNDAVYQFLIRVLNRINVKHTILTHRWKDEYINDNKTGRMTWDHGAFKFIGNHTNVAIELSRNTKAKPTASDWRFRLSFRNCLLNETLQGPAGQPDETGLEDESITFANVARAIFTDVDASILEQEFGE